MYHQTYLFEREKKIYYVILCTYIVPILQQKEEMTRELANYWEEQLDKFTDQSEPKVGTSQE